MNFLVAVLSFESTLNYWTFWSKLIEAALPVHFNTILSSVTDFLLFEFLVSVSDHFLRMVSALGSKDSFSNASFTAFQSFL